MGLFANDRHNHRRCILGDFALDSLYGLREKVWLLDTMKNIIIKIIQKTKVYARYGKFKFIFSIFRQFILIGIAYLMLYPLFQMLANALSTWTDIKEGATVYIPKNPTFLNFTDALIKFRYKDVALYTGEFTIVATICQLFSTSLAGYGLARFKFKGNKIIFALVILTIIIPLQTAQIPLFLEYQKFDFFGIGKLIGFFTGQTVTLNLLNSMWVYVVPAIFGVGLCSGLYIFLFRQMFKTIPQSLDEAAKVDGCGPWGILFRIMLPNAVPVYVTVTLLSFINYWNDTVIGTMFNSQTSLQPLMIYIKLNITNLYMGEDSAVTKVQTCAIYFMTVAPLLLLFVVCQKFFVECMDRSGIKG